VGDTSEKSVRFSPPASARERSHPGQGNSRDALVGVGRARQFTQRWAAVQLRTKGFSSSGARDLQHEHAYEPLGRRSRVPAQQPRLADRTPRGMVSKPL